VVHSPRPAHMNETPSSRVRLRVLTPDDIPFAAALNAQIGWNQTQKDWRGYLEFAPGGCFLAEVEGVPVGTATTLSYEGSVGWIGMVLVDGNHRRLGIGTTLLQHCIRYLTQQGISSIKLDATPMGRKVYLPLGFRDEYDVSRYEGLAPAVSPVDVAVEPLTHDLLSAVAAFDRSAFGSKRVDVLRSLSVRDQGYSLVVKEGGQIFGYLIAREGREAVQVGPCVAKDAVTARALLWTLLSKVVGRRVFLDVPAPNGAAVEAVTQLGFKVQRGFSRMYLGNNPRPGQPEMIFATSGAEKG